MSKNSLLVSSGNWLQRHGPSMFLSVDFAFGLAATGAVFGVSMATQGVVENYVAILLAEAGLGLALLGIAASLMTSFSSMLDREYLWVVERAHLGIRGALFPYKVVAGVSIGSTLLALGVLVAWGVDSPIPLSTMQLRSFGLASASGFTAWAAIGTVQLVALNAFHVTQRAQFLSGIREVRSKASDQKRRKSG